MTAEIWLLSPVDMGRAGGKPAVEQIREIFEAPFDVALRASAFDDGHAIWFAALSRGNCRRLMAEALATGGRQEGAKGRDRPWWRGIGVLDPEGVENVMGVLVRQGEFRLVGVEGRPIVALAALT